MNLSRPGGRSGFAPLHQAASHGDVEAAKALVARGAWLALRTTAGELPFEVARCQGHDAVARMLVPPTEWECSPRKLRVLEIYLHSIMRVRADEQIIEAGLRLPPVEVLTGMRDPRLWCPIPGMYGGFSLTLLRASDDPLLQADSWCRVASGSEQRHHITVRGIEWVDDPFAEAES